jgi:hypothetical protein
LTIARFLVCLTDAYRELGLEQSAALREEVDDAELLAHDLRNGDGGRVVDFDGQRHLLEHVAHFEQHAPEDQVGLFVQQLASGAAAASSAAT